VTIWSYWGVGSKKEGVQEVKARPVLPNRLWAGVGLAQ